MKEFYIGYLPKMPDRLARFLRPAVLVILGFVALLAVVFALGQGRFANSVFEFGNVKEFTGTIHAEPIPYMRTEGEAGNGLGMYQRVVLVSEGKFGADEAREFDGKRVKLRGTLLYRDDLRMIEIQSGSIQPFPPDNEFFEDGGMDLGQMTLRGEIVDSKCYLGAMNPGNHKTHRSCAVACLRGGIPAMFVAKDQSGNTSELWLLSEKGISMNDKILDYVAEPVELSGRVIRSRSDGELFFYADIGTVKRLP